MPFSAQRFIASIPPPSADDLPQASPGIIAASIFVFLESLDEFTGTFLSACRISLRYRGYCITPVCRVTIRYCPLPP